MGIYTSVSELLAVTAGRLQRRSLPVECSAQDEDLQDITQCGLPSVRISANSMMSSMTLSDRFDKIDANRVVIKPVYNTGAAQRRDEMESRRKIGRQTQFDARRQGVANPKPVMRAAQAKVVAPRPQPMPQQQQQRQNFNQGRGQGRGFRGSRMGPRPTGMPPRNSVSNSQRVSGRGSSGRALGGRSGGRGSGGRGGSASGRGGRGRGRSAGRGNNNSYVKQAQDVDLDQSLDEYWFKAGKGPDPEVASLNRGLDNYWNAKSNSMKTERTDQKPSTGGIMSDAAEPSEEASGMDQDL